MARPYSKSLVNCFGTDLLEDTVKSGILLKNDAEQLFTHVNECFKKCLANQVKNESIYAYKQFVEAASRLQINSNFDVDIDSTLYQCKRKCERNLGLMESSEFLDSLLDNW